jgi:hypothetical protein
MWINNERLINGEDKTLIDEDNDKMEKFNEIQRPLLSLQNEQH